MIWRPGLASAALIASAVAAGASTADSCRDLAEIVYSGVIDGLKMAPLLDGVDEAMTAADTGGDIEAERLIGGAYLSGYSAGLVYIDPAEHAENFFTACVSEGV